jgi:hypothetical protein
VNLGGSGRVTPDRGLLPQTVRRSVRIRVVNEAPRRRVGPILRLGSRDCGNARPRSHCNEHAFRFGGRGVDADRVLQEIAPVSEDAKALRSELERRGGG